MRTGNPILTERAFGRERGSNGLGMTLNGTINKTFLMLILIVAAAYYTWSLYMDGGDPLLLMGIGAIGALVVALVTAFAKKAAPFTAPLYAILQGLALGGISAIAETEYPGIVFHAVLLTFGTLFALLAAYKSRLIKVTQNFRLGVFACTVGIAIVYVIDIALRLFGMSVPFIHETGWLGIGISLFIVVIAALNLVLDFDFIESGVGNEAPKYMEWYAAFGLMVTLVWLYIEILRLLSKLRRN